MRENAISAASTNAGTMMYAFFDVHSPVAAAKPIAAIDLNDPYFLTAKEFVYKTLEDLDQKDHLPVLFYKEFYNVFKDRDDFRKCVDHYLSIMMIMIDDALKSQTSDDREYQQHLDLIRAHDPGKLLEIFADASDRVGMNAERKLLFDAISYEIISYI